MSMMEERTVCQKESLLVKIKIIRQIEARLANRVEIQRNL